MASPDSMNDAFKALANPNRRRILDILKNRGGSTVGEVCGHFKISRIAVMKHIGILEEANLIYSEKEGRSRKLYINVIPIQMIYDRWSTEYSSLWAGHLTEFKYRVEKKGKKK